MNNKYFQINDLVEFELSSQGHQNVPRWQQNIDTGGNGKWTTGIVHKLDIHRMIVSYAIDGFVGTGECEWPYTLSPDYRVGQWNWPGYLRKKIVLKCECGGEKAKTTHSRWCPIYE